MLGYRRMKRMIKSGGIAPALQGSLQGQAPKEMTGWL